MADLAELLRQLAFYRGGGGDRQVGVGGALGSIGQSLANMGTGINTAIAPVKEEFDFRRKLASALMEKSIGEGAPISGEQAMQAVMSGTIPKDFIFGGKKEKPLDQSLILNPDAVPPDKIGVPLPPGTKVEFIPRKPNEPIPRAENSAEVAKQTAINKIVIAARNKKYSIADKEGNVSSQPMATQGDFDVYAQLLGVDPEDPKVMKARSLLPEGEATPVESGWSILAPIMGAKNIVKKGLTAGLTAATSAILSNKGNAIDPIGDYLKSIKAADNKVNREWAKKKLGK